MTPKDLFARIIEALERTSIPYMLTGSFASSYHGMPRSTQDLDIVVAPTVEQLRALAVLLPASEYYLDIESAVDAYRRETQFNLVDLATGWKIDLIIRKSRRFSQEEFERRAQVELYGLPIYIATLEDMIIAKMEWAKAAVSSRQIDDVAGILRVRAPEVDWDYVQRWVDELGLSEEWADARKQANYAP